MAFLDYLKVPTAVELTQTAKTGALAELVRAAVSALGLPDPKPILDEVLRREESASTYAGRGLALPHARVPIKEEFAIVVGRSRQGIPYDAARGGKAQIVVLLLTREKSEAGAHLQMLAEIASLFRSRSARERLLASEAPADVRAVLSGPRRAPRGAARAVRQPQDPLLAAAGRLAEEIGAKRIVVFADTVSDNSFVNQFKPGAELVIVASDKTRFAEADKRVRAVINAPSFPAARFDQMKIGILLALSRNLLSREDKVVCISGNPRKGVFDTIVVLDIGAEYEFFFTHAQNILPADVKPEVLERVLSFAAEIAVEGREGKPLGTIFVIGDTDTVNTYVRQLIINPFRGYPEAERNVLDPGLDETIKEFAAIDGAFIITGDGIVLSAGSYLRPQVAETENLPSGLGARHAAAAGITACTASLAVTVSESTGMVSLFKSGMILMTISKPMVQERGVVQRMQ